ncbi:unnamed protein product [Acanthoscelides obtectus]|uniref:WD repeat-containing protein 55 homolog n=1 Tax=Acanthoscelides obtectus TaxID=200917 RepID=A0A9P0NWX0_ACAOB|nr:unnamed protein product [Acanthoscelides obtectus]CAK1641423.1 WD repeat-containing protein 55 homolog [Acanthoscelides obtectus]
MEEADSCDVSMSDGESSEMSISIEDHHDTENESDLDDNTKEEDEDDTIKAIQDESRKQRDRPPNIECEHFITDLCFHPEHDLLAVANIVGDVLLYKYSSSEATLEETLELHTKACRDIEFSQNGNLLFSTSKDKSIMITDMNSGKLMRFYDNSHDSPINCISVIDENIFATGDDDGMLKLWDLREKKDTQQWKTKKNTDYISDIITNDSRQYLVYSSGDGSLTTIDLKNRSVFMQSEEYDEDLTCLGLFRSETKLLAGSSKGKLYIYNWSEFGLHSDAFPGPKTTINAMVPITENIVITACEDGNLRATHLFPHRHLGIAGQHNLSVENVDICNTGKFIASSSHDNDIRFWNIEYFEDFEKVSQKHNKHNTRKELRNNLPSSMMKNSSDFFSGLC